MHNYKKSQELIDDIKAGSFYEYLFKTILPVCVIMHPISFADTDDA